jgi:hypothetical protein
VIVDEEETESFLELTGNPGGESQIARLRLDGSVAQVSLKQQPESNSLLPDQLPSRNSG